LKTSGFRKVLKAVTWVRLGGKYLYRKSYMIYRMVPFLITLNDRKPDFNGTPLFDVEYLRNDTR